MIIAMSVYGYMFDPSVKYEINSWFYSNNYNNEGNYKIVKQSTPISTNNIDECQTKAIYLLPQEVELIQTNKKDEYRVNNIAWKDGTKISYEDYKDINFLERREEGGTHNYYYQYKKEDNYFSYTKKVVDSEGFVLGSNKFKVQLVLTFTGEKRSVYDKFKLVGYKFLECEWVA